MAWANITPRERLYKIMRADIDPLYFMTDPYFLGQKLWPKQIEIVTEFFRGGYRRFILVAGQRSSKTYIIGSLFAPYEAFKLLIKDYVKTYGLAKDSPVFITMVAASETQIEDTAFYHIRARMINSPFFSYYKPKYKTDSITFPSTKSNVIIRALASVSVTAAGRTNKAVFMDEVAGMRDTTGPMGGMKIYDKLDNSTTTFKSEGHTYIAGSPEAPKDVLMRLHARGLNDPGTLALKLPTWELNPDITRESLKHIEDEDPIRFWRDFGADPQSQEDVYYRNQNIIRFKDDQPNLLQRLLQDHVEVHPPQARYVMAGDPSLKHDAFGVCLAHRDMDVYVIDGVMRYNPIKQREIDPLQVGDDFLKVAEFFPVSDVAFDTWHYAETQARLQRRGILVHNHIVRKPEHDRVKELFYDRKLICPYNDVLETELKQLIVKSNTKVDHPKGGSKDIADALANVCWLLDQQEHNISLTSLQVI